MYLIDTSVFIDYFRGIQNSAVIFFENIIHEKLPYGLTGVIYQEVLQGASSEKDKRLLQSGLSTQRCFQPSSDWSTYEAAAEIYYQCRKAGITIRSTIDCLISQICIEHELVLVHHDVDYQRIQQVVPALKLFE